VESEPDEIGITSVSSARLVVASSCEERVSASSIKSRPSESNSNPDGFLASADSPTAVGSVVVTVLFFFDFLLALVLAMTVFGFLFQKVESACISAEQVEYVRHGMDSKRLSRIGINTYRWSQILFKERWQANFVVAFLRLAKQSLHSFKNFLSRKIVFGVTLRIV
jgi:hypothetical protein